MPKKPIIQRKTGHMLAFERRTSMLGAEGDVNPLLACCEAACVHEEVAIADSEYPLFKGEFYD